MEAEKVIEALFSSVSEDVWERAKKIKLLITDIDGVMTDGGLIYDDRGLEFKKFNVKDGLIVKHLRRSGVLIGAITGRESQVVMNRCEELRFDFHYHGVKAKGKKLKDLIETMEIDQDAIAYIGDDLIDLPIFSQVGLAIAPSDAVSYVKPYAHWITSTKGGEGVFREVGDLILHSKGLLVPIIENLSKKET
ncbi:HAD hydrolase family protein [Algoriphagus sp. SE2]|uniref:KdsC family phosphatase n=1 Tax=Algoriphagus sp. SE2 TaxID=3141536 RepID=UPI0031CD9ECB